MREINKMLAKTPNSPKAHSWGIKEEASKNHKPKLFKIILVETIKQNKKILGKLTEDVNKQILGQMNKMINTPTGNTKKKLGELYKMM